jgi:UDP-N-acetylmuramyl pentapeptide synthase
VHLEGMGSLETIAREKSLLAAAAPPGGRAWLPAELSARLAAHSARWAAPVDMLPGLAEPGLFVHARQPGAWRIAHPAWGDLTLPLVAEHEVELALAAARIAAAQGASPSELRSRLARLIRPHGRLETHAIGACTILDDAYNASPASVRAALATLAAWPGAGRRIAVLGTMNELGAAAEELHRAAGGDAAAAGLDRIVTVGRGGPWIADGARAAGAAADAFDAVEAAGAAVAADLRKGDVILLKASRAERLDRLLGTLTAAAARGRCDAASVAGVD